MESKRVAVTLTNGRSHLVDAPASVAPEDVAAVIRGEAAATDVGWPEGEAGWLSFGNGQGWVRQEQVAEIMLVDTSPRSPRTSIRSSTEDRAPWASSASIASRSSSDRHQSIDSSG